METNQKLSFLQEKIQEIGTAIFFNLSDSVIKLPTSIVSNLRVDDYGFVWFTATKQNKEMQEFETGFPVRLDLFRKGVNYYMQLEGSSWIVSDPEEIFNLEPSIKDLIEGDTMDRVLVKMKIVNVDVYETGKAIKTPFWSNAVSILSALLGSNYQYRPKNTFFPASS